ncbi:hypothetical protein [endosymbiont GvMRE of Glomus versiforme]|uniref:hypothetical protein n=1 Tax=endosymbiont GvMRE of Glomus versiforme TaxID=2039283 RepID=UPI0011C3DE25|nr:hypothetical protein [endosymbiont GvMRE of Glomus versiforme]
MKKKLKQCPKCGETFPEWIEESEFKHAEKITKILKSSKTPHEKKIALFNWLKGLDVGELQPQENQRVNSLLLSRLYNELAKKAMKEYEKTTADIFSKKE